MTTTQEEFSAPRQGDDLRALLLEGADPTLLVNCLVQMTGDPSWLDRYAPHFHPLAVRSILDSHTWDPAAAEEIVDRVVAELSSRGDGAPENGSAVDEELFRRMASSCVG